MHSNYGGGVSEMQQFMMDGCPSSLFSISTSPPPPPQNSNSGAAEVQKFHPLQHHLQQQPPPPMPPHFAHFGQPIPITQQLFQQSHHPHVHPHHQFQLFQQHQQQQQQQQQHMGLDQESGPENSNSPARMMGGGGGGPSFLAAMNFKLGVNESGGGGGGGGGGSRDGINEDEGILQGDDDGSESRLHHHHHQHRHPWHREEESAAAANIKEPFWRPLDIDFINPNNKRPAKDKQPAAAATTAEISSSSSIKHFKKSNDSGAAAATDSNYKLFSELEAIYKPGGGGGVGGGGGETNNNQTGSGSALTGDDNPLVPVAAPGPTGEHGQPDNISDTSNADDAPQKKTQKDSSNSGGDAVRRKRSRKRRQQRQLSSIATFFESLVKQLMDHQESLHRKFLEVMEKKDQERGAREEACRKQEAAKANREAAARAQERALAATREAAIISFLEKISGESLNLPTKAQFQSQFTEESQQKDNNEDNAVEIYNADSTNNNNNSGGGGLMQFNSSRWPKAEVQALIRVRSGFESKFQEPGLKGPLWEEVSLAMATMGYQRSAKRCKEKWENINKYFRKTKDSGKKRPQHSKTCPYFHQLDQLYSKTPSLSNANHGRKETNSELLDAIVVSNEAKRNEEGNEEEGQGESQDQEENADDGDRSPVRMEQSQEHNSSDHHLLNRLNS